MIEAIISKCWGFILAMAFVIGSIKLALFYFDLFGLIGRIYNLKQHDLLERYGGKGTWALVTGASDGIGAEISKQMADKGFNVCLVSRT